MMNFGSGFSVIHKVYIYGENIRGHVGICGQDCIARIKMNEISFFVSCCSCS